MTGCGGGQSEPPHQIVLGKELSANHFKLCALVISSFVLYIWIHINIKKNAAFKLFCEKMLNWEQ